MIHAYQVFPVVAIVCSVGAFAQETATPVQLTEQNIALIASADKVLSGIKTADDVAGAITQIKSLTDEAKKIDKALDKVQLTTDQAVKISQLNGESQKVIISLINNCERLQNDKLMTKDLLKAINKFADKANIEVVESVTEVTEVVED